MSEREGERRVVLQVVVPDRETCTEVEGCLEASGFALLRNGDVSSNQQLGVVRSALEITAHERAILEALFIYDRSKEMATVLETSLMLDLSSPTLATSHCCYTTDTWGNREYYNCSTGEVYGSTCPAEGSTTGGTTTGSTTGSTTGGLYFTLSGTEYSEAYGGSNTASMGVIVTDSSGVYPQSNVRVDFDIDWGECAWYTRYTDPGGGAGTNWGTLDSGDRTLMATVAGVRKTRQVPVLPPATPGAWIIIYSPQNGPAPGTYNSYPKSGYVPCEYGYSAGNLKAFTGGSSAPYRMIWNTSYPSGYGTSRYDNFYSSSGSRGWSQPGSSYVVGINGHNCQLYLLRRGAGGVTRYGPSVASSNNVFFKITNN
jgi:hypothetical protein